MYMCVRVLVCVRKMQDGCVGAHTHEHRARTAFQFKHYQLGQSRHLKRAFEICRAHAHLRALLGRLLEGEVLARTRARRHAW